MADVDKLVPNDPRVQYKTAKLNGRTYGYILGEPTSTKRGTIFLVHGFPDFSFGWRYQIPFLMSLGLRVVVPDMMGYGRTDAPPYTLKKYGYKQAADDMNELAKQLNEPRIILGGHDWGGAIVPRIALHYPALVSHVFTICTPYFPPSPTYVPLPLVTAKVLTSFTYQNQFASGEIEETIPPTTEGVTQFLRTLYGGRTPSGNFPFSYYSGFDLPEIPHVGAPALLTPEEFSHYVAEYTQDKPVRDTHPLHGPLNYYRVRETNYVNSDLPLLSQPGSDGKPPELTQPYLFIPAKRDAVFTPELIERMKTPGLIRSLTIREVDTGHWAMAEKPAVVNGILKEWIEGVVFGGEESKL